LQKSNEYKLFIPNVLLLIMKLLHENLSLVSSKDFNSLSSSLNSKIKSLGDPLNLRLKSLLCTIISNSVDSKAKVKSKYL